MSLIARSAPTDASRLRAIAALDLAGTPPEREFDALAALAARLLDCPIGLVTLVEQDRVWVTGAAGIELTEAARNDAICNVTVALGQPLIVPDTQDDSRTRSSPFTRGEDAMRAYAGISISAPDPEGGARVAVGSVCGLDRVPRAFTPDQQAVLDHLRTLAEALFDSRALRMRAEKQSGIMRRSDRVFRQAERLAEMGSWRFDLDDETLSWSDGVYRIHDLPVGSPPELRSAIDFYPEHARGVISAALASTIETGTPFDVEVDFISARGVKRRVRSVGELELCAGRPCAVVGVFQDITERHAIEESLRRSASVDELTRIANRAAFNTELERRVAAAQANNVPLALVLIDGDHFKAINDTYGHLAGDDVLRAFGRRLRRVDAGDGLAARLGGDEFGLVLNGPAATRVDGIVTQLLADLKIPVHSSAGLIDVSATIGYASYEPEEGTVRAFIHRADTALYEAKRFGRGTARGWRQLREGDRRAA